MDVSIKGREAFLTIAIHVRGERVASLLHRLEERAEEGIGRGATLENQRAGGAAILISPGQAVLHLLEVRQTVTIVPLAHPGIAGPTFVVEWVAPLEDHAVDAAGATQQFSARVIDLATAHVRFRFRLVLPVVEAIADRNRERGRHVRKDVPLVVGATGLEYEYVVCGIGA